MALTMLCVDALLAGFLRLTHNREQLALEVEKSIFEKAREKSKEDATKAAEAEIEEKEKGTSEATVCYIAMCVGSLTLTLLF